MADSAQKSEKIFAIIAEEVGISRDELAGATEFAELAVDSFLAKHILSRVSEELKLDLPITTFDTCPTAESLQLYLSDSLKPTLEAKTQLNKLPSATASHIPLSLVLQGQPKSSKKTLFLLPDGSGSGMAYALLPKLDPDICLVALNSPFLRSASEGRFSVEGIAAVWAEDIQRRQSNGPYFLGGWSAGGYYAFEVAKILIRNGQKVQKLVLIDSPCRLVYEELPMEVVRYLASNNLMGNWGTEQPPAWMISHFNMAIRAISTYAPTPMQVTSPPDVSIIWAQDGVLNEADCGETGLDLNIKVTRMLMQRPESDGPLGWDMLLPGAKLSISQTPGNHFTIVYPPHVGARVF